LQCARDCCNCGASTSDCVSRCDSCRPCAILPYFNPNPPRPNTSNKTGTISLWGRMLTRPPPKPASRLGSRIRCGVNNGSTSRFAAFLEAEAEAFPTTLLPRLGQRDADKILGLIEPKGHGIGTDQQTFSRLEPWGKPAPRTIRAGPTTRNPHTQPEHSEVLHPSKCSPNTPPALASMSAIPRVPQPPPTSSPAYPPPLGPTCPPSFSGRLRSCPPSNTTPSKPASNPRKRPRKHRPLQTPD